MRTLVVALRRWAFLAGSVGDLMVERIVGAVHPRLAVLAGRPVVVVVRLVIR